MEMSYLSSPPTNLSVYNDNAFMRSNCIKALTVFIFFLIASYTLIAQDCVRTGLYNTTITSLCNQTCRDLTFQIPDIRSTSSYTFVSTPYNPFPYVTAGGTTDNRL